MIDVNQVYRVENFLSKEESKAFTFFCSHYNWEPLGVSHSTNKVFWLKDMWEGDLGKCKEIESTFRNKIETLFDVKLETQRMYLNGQAHGQCGSIHVDNNSDEEVEYVTAVYYANDEWSPEYGGFTVILEEDKSIKYISYPEPNSLIIFNSKLPHIGLEPTTHCRTQRITMAQKFKVL